MLKGERVIPIQVHYAKTPNWIIILKITGKMVNNVRIGCASNWLIYRFMVAKNTKTNVQG